MKFSQTAVLVFSRCLSPYFKINTTRFTNLKVDLQTITASIIPIVLYDSPNGYIVSYFYRPFYISIDLFISSFFVSNYLAKLYIPRWLIKFSNLWCSDYWKMRLHARKMKVYILTLLQVKLSLKFLSSPQGRWKLLIPQKSMG